MRLSTLLQIEAALLLEIEHFELPDRSDTSQYVGTAWSSDRYREEIAKMRECLVPAYWCKAKTGDDLELGDQTEPTTERFALVAKDDYYVLLFDTKQETYALGWVDEEGTVSAFMYGDAVSTFLAR